MQYVLTPLQSLVADGCHLNRDTLTTIEQSGLFREVDAERMELSEFLIGSHIVGVARVA